MPSLGYLRLQCRRGMLELDFILQSFLAHHYGNLSSVDQTTFIRLLTAEDNDLWSWFMANSSPKDDELKKMVALILSHTRKV